jgi:paraquat-inducible protein B
VADESLDVQIEVLLEVDYSDVRDPDNLARTYRKRSFQELTEHMIAIGLRATLETSSLLTGQRYINLDFYPETQIRLTGLDPRYPELPTHATALERVGEDLQQLVARMEDVPLEEAVHELALMLRNLNALLTRPGFEELPRDLAQAARDASRMANTLTEEISGSGEDLETLAESLRETSARMDRVLGQIEIAAGQSAPLGRDVARTLEELADAARAVRILAEYLELHPEAMLTGKESKP